MIPHFINATEVSPVVPADAAMISAGSEIHGSDGVPVRFNLYAVPTLSEDDGEHNSISTGMWSYFRVCLDEISGSLNNNDAKKIPPNVHSGIPSIIPVSHRSDFDAAVPHRHQEMIRTVFFGDYKRVYKTNETYRRINDVSSDTWTREHLTEVDGTVGLHCEKALSMAGKMVRPILSEVIRELGFNNLPLEVNIVHALPSSSNGGCYSQMHIGIGNRWLLVYLLRGDCGACKHSQDVFGALVIDTPRSQGNKPCDIAEVRSINDIARFIVAGTMSKLL